MYCTVAELHHHYGLDNILVSTHDIRTVHGSTCPAPASSSSEIQPGERTTLRGLIFSPKLIPWRYLRFAYNLTVRKPASSMIFCTCNIHQKIYLMSYCLCSTSIISILSLCFMKDEYTWIILTYLAFLYSSHTGQQFAIPTPTQPIQPIYLLCLASSYSGLKPQTHPIHRYKPRLHNIGFSYFYHMNSTKWNLVKPCLL